MNTPLIVTVCLDDHAQFFFDEKRKQYFPPELNFISAHLTLFHHLPDNEPMIINTIDTVCMHQKKIPLEVKLLVNIGKGVAYKIESKVLIALHKRLQKEWLQLLTPQDRQGLWPHVTIQNKVSIQASKKTVQDLQQEFTPFIAYANGLTLWRYLNGPWQLYRQFVFAG